LAGAAILILTGILRNFASAISDPIEYILGIYYLLFGLLMGFSELKMEKMVKYFKFMLYSLGKAFLDFFLFGLLFRNSIWPGLHIPASIFFLFAGLLNLAIALMHRKSDNDKAEEIESKAVI
jgi:hypothetical protein